MSGEANQPGASADQPPASTQAAPQPPAAEPVPAPSPEESVSMPKGAFNERLQRERKAAVAAYLKEMGYDSVEAFADAQKAHKKAAKEAEEKRRAEMSELERYKADLADRDQKLAEATAAMQAAEEKAEAARIEAHLGRLFAARGIKDHDYARLLLERHSDALPDGEGEFDEEVFLDELLKDPHKRFALGVDGEPPTTSMPAKTTAPKGGPDPRAPGSGPKSALEMTPEQYQAFLSDPNARIGG